MTALLGRQMCRSGGYSAARTPSLHLSVCRRRAPDACASEGNMSSWQRQARARVHSMPSQKCAVVASSTLSCPAQLWLVNSESPLLLKAHAVWIYLQLPLSLEAGMAE